MPNNKRLLARTVAGSPAGKRSAPALEPILSRADVWLRQHWLLTQGALGVALGAYLWQFLATNQDFTGPLPIGLPLGLALTFLLGPLAVWGGQALSARILARWTGRSYRECRRSDALSLLLLALLGASPLLGLLTGWHSTAYHATVVVLVSLAFSGCLALKAATAWQLGLRLNLNGRRARYLLAGATVLFCLVFLTLQVLRYNAYQLWGVDHSMVTQALWNTLHGRFLAFTFVYGIDLNLLADHFEPIYTLLVPAYGVWPDSRLPLLVQVVALALGAWPLFHIARRRLQNPTLALGWALTYLLLPMTVSAAQDSAGAVRPDALAIPIFMFMLDALDRRKWLVFALTVVLAFAAKQYLSLLVAMLGLWLAIRQRRWGLGLGLFALGTLWFVVLVQWLMPALGGGPNLTLAGQFGPEVGEAGLAGLAQLLVTDPGTFLARFFSPNHFLFVFFLLFSFGGLALLEPLLAAVGLPLFAIFSLALPHGPVNLGNHHYYPLVPFFLVAAVYGVAALDKRVTKRYEGNARRVAAALTAFALGMGLTASFFWISSPLSWSFWDRRAQTAYWGNRYVAGEHAQLADEFVERVPPEVPVLASDYLLAHLANRPQVYHFFRPPEDVLQRVDYAVADLLQNHVRTGDMMAAEKALLRDLLAGPAFALVAHEDGLLFFERGASGGYTSRAGVLAERPRPQVRLERDLGGRLRLLGYDPPPGPLRAGERCQVTFYWQVLTGFDAPFALKLGVNPESVEAHQVDYVLADRFAGPSGEFGVLHLPTYLQVPPEQWQPGQIIQETYEFRLSARAQGRYTWTVGLYAVPRFLGIRLDDGRRVPDTEPIVLDTVQVQPDLGGFPQPPRSAAAHHVGQGAGPAPTSEIFRNLRGLSPPIMLDRVQVQPRPRRFSVTSEVCRRPSW
jgi:uncharacterized membrane protein